MAILLVRRNLNQSGILVSTLDAVAGFALTL
jgi:hypothetical protein